MHSCGRRNAAVQRHGHFHQNERAIVPAPARKALIESACFVLADAYGCLQARSSQRSHAVACHVRIGIDGGGDDAVKLGVDERLRAGRRAARMITGFERDVCDASLDPIASLLLCFAQSGDLSVVEEIVLMPAFSDYLARAIENDTADCGIGRSNADAPARKLIHRRSCSS